MTKIIIPQWLIYLLIIGVLPTIACSGYYAVGGLNMSHTAWGIPVALAYPTAIIGAIGFTNVLLTRRYTKLKLWLWGLVTFLSVLLLVITRFY